MEFLKDPYTKEQIALFREMHHFYNMCEANDRLWCYLEDPNRNSDLGVVYVRYGSVAYEKAQEETAADQVLLDELAYAFEEFYEPDRTDDERWGLVFNLNATLIATRLRQNLYNNRDVCLPVLQGELRKFLRDFVSGDYASTLAENEEFSKAVLNDLLVCTNMYAGEPYNEDDLRLAVGRVLMKKYGMSV